MRLDKLKWATNNETGITLRLSSNIVGNTTMKLMFCIKFQSFVMLLQIFMKLSRTQLSNIVQSGGFHGKLLGPLLKTSLPFMKD